MKQKVVKGERVQKISFQLCISCTNWILNVINDCHEQILTIVMLRPLYANSTKLCMLTWHYIHTRVVTPKKSECNQKNDVITYKTYIPMALIHVP